MTSSPPPALEWPDKRVWIFLGPLLLSMLGWAVLPAEHPWAKPVELSLYALLLGFGLVIGLLSLREGHSLMRPSIRRENEPQLFKIEVWVGCFASAAFGLWQLVELLA